jgi:hypothetical protein
VPANPRTGAKAPEKPVRPTDLSHVRVGPPFKAKFDKPCLACRQPTKDTECAMVENTRTAKKATIHERCLQLDSALLARRDVETDIDGFLQ